MNEDQGQPEFAEDWLERIQKGTSPRDRLIAAIEEKYGLWNDPVLSPETLEEMADFILEFVPSLPIPVEHFCPYCGASTHLDAATGHRLHGAHSHAPPCPSGIPLVTLLPEAQL